jgi:hypothetical protein
MTYFEHNQGTKSKWYVAIAPSLTQCEDIHFASSQLTHPALNIINPSPNNLSIPSIRVIGFRDGSLNPVQTLAPLCELLLEIVLFALQIFQLARSVRSADVQGVEAA